MGQIEGLLDTSVLVRYLTNDDASLAERAAAIIDNTAHLGITLVVLLETAFVLERVYGCPRKDTVDSLLLLLQKENLVALDLSKERVIQALLLCRPSARVSYADAFIWAQARDHHIDRVFTFDARFPTEGIRQVGG